MSVHTGGKSYFLSGMGSAYVPMYVNLYLPSGSRQCKHGSLRRSVSLFFSFEHDFRRHSDHFDCELTELLSDYIIRYIHGKFTYIQLVTNKEVGVT